MGGGGGGGGGGGLAGNCQGPILSNSNEFFGQALVNDLCLLD